MESGLSLDEHACADLLASLRWPEGLRCRRCSGRRFGRLARRPRVFACAACGAHHSVTAGTALHGSKLPLRAWLHATRRVVEGVTARALERELDVTYETAFQLLHKVRRGLAALCPPELPPPTPDRWRVGWSLTPTRLPWLREPHHWVGLIAVELDGGWRYALVRDRGGEALLTNARALKDNDARRPANVAAVATAHLLVRRYRTVSVRWLRRYLIEREFVERRGAAESLRRALLAEPRRPWRDVLPITEAAAEPR